MVEISEIWIITDGGIPLFNRSVDKQIDALVFGGFLSAIQTFIKSSLHEEKMDKLVLGDSKLSFHHVDTHEIFIVVRSHKKAKDKEIQKILQTIRDLFIAKYEEKLRRKDCDITEYNEFNAILDENLEENFVVKRIQNWFELV